MRRRFATSFFILALLGSGFAQPLAATASAAKDSSSAAVTAGVAAAPATAPADVVRPGMGVASSLPAYGGQAKSDSPKADWQVAEVAASATANGATAADAEAGKLGLTVAHSKVRLIVEASDLAQAEDSIAASGVTIEGTAGNLIQVLVAPTQLNALIADPGVNWVRPPLPHFEDAVVPDEGVASTNADNWQASGHDGTGVKIAVIDDGFTGLADAQASGDLPASVTSVDDCSGAFDTGGDHGTAVAEIVYKMAPGAQLYLICIGTEVQLAAAEAYVKATGIQIVNHSLTWFNTSRGDGTGAAGTPDATVKDANSHGILWVNAAGNYAEDHWSGTFKNNGYNYNLFATGDIGNAFYLDTGETVCAALKWDNWPATKQDYDLLLAESSDDNLVDVSANTQTGTQPPTEALCYTNDDVYQEFFFAIGKYKATTAPRFDLFVYGPPIQYETPAGSVSEPASAPSAFAVGAACWSGTTIEPYSSQGPTISGVVKPDITGPDQTSSSVFGDYTSCSDLNGFAGTSASAPHVAGAAADVKSANPTFTNAQLESYLQTHAIDKGAAGKDSIYGSGLLSLPAPGAPTGVVAAGYNLSAGVSWVAPVSNGGSAITHYTVTSSPESRTCTTTGALFCIVTGLTNGQPYTFTVTATNAITTSDPSTPSAPATPAAVPDAPTNVAATGDATSAVVTWGVPDSDNGSAITGYTATAIPGGQNCATTTALTCTISGLTTHTAYTIGVTATNGNGTGPAGKVAFMPRVGNSFVPVTPNRILDTHNALGIATSLAANVPATFAVTGQDLGDPSGNVPAGATAVTGVLSVSGATNVGFLSLTPVAPVGPPTTSTLNFPAGDARATGVTVTLSNTGTLSLTYGATTGTADATFDVTGYFILGTSGSTYFALTPNRILDSRASAKIGITTGQLVAGTHKSFAVIGRAPTDSTKNVPAGAIAVTGTLTVTGQTAAGFLTLGPDPLDAPSTASLFFPIGDNRATGLTIKLASDGSLDVTFTSSTAGAKTDAIFDVNGYFLPGESGAMYVPLTPNRLVDTRIKLGIAAKIKSHVAATFQVTGRVPADPTQNVPAGAVAITGTLTVTGQSALGWLALTNLPNNNPTTSSLNFPKGDNRATGVTVPLSSAGKLSVTYGAVAGATTAVVFDVSGYFVN
jgi:hypothetical protein